MTNPTLLLSLRSCFAELDDLKDANERAAIYGVVAEHLRSAEPMTWVAEMESRIAAWLEQNADDAGVGGPALMEAAELIRAGGWRQP
jgi:hypothetical protein